MEEGVDDVMAVRLMTVEEGETRARVGIQMKAMDATRLEKISVVHGANPSAGVLNKLGQLCTKQVGGAREPWEGCGVSDDTHLDEGETTERRRAHVVGLDLTHTAQRLNGVIVLSNLIDLAAAEEDRPAFNHSRFSCASDVGHFLKRVFVPFEWLIDSSRRFMFR